MLVATPYKVKRVESRFGCHCHKPKDMYHYWYKVSGTSEELKYFKANCLMHYYEVDGIPLHGIVSDSPYKWHSSIAPVELVLRTDANLSSKFLLSPI